MVSSIISNIAAYSAQGNIGKASASAASSIARLSSGNRIVHSSDDVAALSVGTALASTVTTLKQALANTTQGTSLLQVADGALAQISDILQRQKAIATQANSGTLSDTERGYLNQEFQALTSQVDQIAGSTTFSSVNLLDGSLAGSNPLQSAVNGNTSATIGVVKGAVANTVQGAVVAGAISSTVTFKTNAGTAPTLADTTFIGDLSQGTFKVDYVANGTYADFAISYNINGSTYSANIADITAGTTTLKLANGKGEINLTIANADWTNVAVGAAKSTTGALNFQNALTSVFSGATAYGQRAVLTADASSNGVTVAHSAIKSTDTAGTILAGLTGADVTLSSKDFEGLNLPTITNLTGDSFGTGAHYSVTIAGKTYTTKAIANSPTNFKTVDLFGDGAGVMKFYLDGDATANANDYLKIDLNSNVTNGSDITTEEANNNFVSALGKLFGTTGGGLSLQVGTASTDTLSVSLQNVSTSQLYVDSSGISQTLDVTTINGAQTASTVLDNAIATVNSTRAAVGALESRVNFTAANLQSSIQNQDAARGTLLDTDVSTESTAYAQSQVQLQAGIAVLAQANLLPQNLLKLIQ